MINSDSQWLSEFSFIFFVTFFIFQRIIYKTTNIMENLFYFYWFFSLFVVFGIGATEDFGVLKMLRYVLFAPIVFPYMLGQMMSRVSR